MLNGTEEYFLVDKYCHLHTSMSNQNPDPGAKIKKKKQAKY